MDVTLIVWILALAQFTVAAKKKGNQCVSPEDITVSTYTCIKITCRKSNYVIADLQIASGLINVASGRMKNPQCTGETIRLIHESFDCYWRHSCRIKFPTSNMITSRNDGLKGFVRRSDLDLDIGGRCFRKKPNFVCVLSAKCVKESDIIDIPSSLTYMTHITRKSGILRSHRQYPWNYDLDSLNKTSNIEIVKNISQSESFRLQFNDLDIHDDNTITMTTKVKNITVNSTKTQIINKPAPEQGIVEERSNSRTVLHEDVTIKSHGDVLGFSGKDEYVSVRFNFGPDADNWMDASGTGYRGFLVCYTRKVRRKPNKRAGKQNKKGQTGKQNKKMRDGERSRRGAGGKKTPCRRVLKNAKITIIYPYSKECMDSLDNKKGRREKCCCDRTDKCDSAIFEALSKHCVESTKDGISLDRCLKN